MYPVKLLSLLLTLVLIFSCSKKDPAPPEPPAPPMLTEATQTGEHSLSFLLNDEVWISQTGWRDLEASISVASRTLLVDSQGPTGNFGIGLALNDWGPGTYVYSDHPSLRSSSYAFGDSGECYWRYRANPADSFNILNVTHLETSQTNPNEQWISATFQFRMTEDSDNGCGDTLYITNGRFDIRYQATP